jgi:hypothetical protein
MAQYVTRTGAVTAAVRTTTSVAAQGSITSPGGVQVPTGVSQIVQVIATVADNPATTTGGHSWFIRLAGNALLATGEVDLPIGSTASVLTTLGAAAIQKMPVVIPTAIPVTPGNSVTITADNDGVGTPTARVAVTLVFA